MQGQDKGPTPSPSQTSFKIDEGLQKRVQPTLTKLVLYLCQHKPEDPVSFQTTFVTL